MLIGDESGTQLRCRGFTFVGLAGGCGGGRIEAARGRRGQHAIGAAAWQTLSSALAGPRIRFGFKLSGRVGVKLLPILKEWL